MFPLHFFLLILIKENYYAYVTACIDIKQEQLRTGYFGLNFSWINFEPASEFEMYI